MEYRYTKAGIRERIGESSWQAPEHQISIEIDTPSGVRRKNVAGIKTARTFGGHIRGPLTDKKIDEYTHNGFYEMRSAYLTELQKKKQEGDFMPRLVYDCDKQDFIIAYE